ncbi:MAG: STAS domain-containing protein [Oscillospiraceae bacterium]|nr:STAS domain-containing protein [Oscillospiraceae bacterium]
MEVLKKINEEQMIAEVIGRIDVNTSSDLASELSDIPENVKCLILDFSQMSYISSAGLRVVFQLHRKMKAKNGEMILRNVNDFVYETLDSVGFVEVFTIENNC